jgi:hypothetical protein
MRFRVSIGHLIAVIASCGLAFGALRDPSTWWASGLTLVALAAIVLAVLVAAIGRRPDFLGFALAGGLYAALVFAPGLSERTRPLLPTTWAIDWFPISNSGIGILECPDDLTTTVGTVTYIPLGGFQRWVAVSFTPTPSYYGLAAMTDEQRVGHSLFTLLAGALGWSVARALRRPGAGAGAASA